MEQREGWRKKGSKGLTDKQKDRQADRQTDRQTNRKTDRRQTNIQIIIILTRRQMDEQINIKLNKYYP